LLTGQDLTSLYSTKYESIQIKNIWSSI